MGGRYPVPLMVAQATGRTQVNPERFANRADNGHVNSDAKLGDPPYYFDELQREVWNDYRTNCWWLVERDRDFMATACVMKARLRADPYNALAYVINAVLRAEAMIGCTPTTFGRVNMPDSVKNAKEDDEDDFLNKHAA